MGRPTAAPAHFPYAHPTLAEIVNADAIAEHAPGHAAFMLERARSRALALLHSHRAQLPARSDVSRSPCEASTSARVAA